MSQIHWKFFNWFLFLPVIVRVHDNKRVQSWKFKTSLWISNHDPLSRTLNNTNFYPRKFLAKLNDNIFQNNKKNLFWGHFCAKGIFPKNYGQVQLQLSPSIYMSNIQSGLAITQKIIPSLSVCKDLSINLLNSSNHLWDTADFRTPWSLKPRSFFNMTTQ